MGGRTADLLMAEISPFVIVLFCFACYEVFGYGRTWEGIKGGILLASLYFVLGGFGVKGYDL